MSHYDLYASLGVDRTASSAEIATDIEARITNAGTRTDARTDELSLALAVLGDPARRELYDRQLDNPSAPEITTEAVRQLARLTPPGNPPNARTPVVSPVVTYSPGNSSDTAHPSRGWPSWATPVSAMAAILAVAAVLITWIVTSGNDSSETTAGSDVVPTFANETSTESEPTSRGLPTPTSSPSSESEPELSDGVTVPTGERVDTFGWVGDDEQMPNCEGHPGDWLFAASNGDDRVIICETSNGLHYKGYYAGNYGSRPIDTAKSGPGKYYTTTRDAITGSDSRWVFEITDAGLTLKDPSNYEEKPGRNFTWSCERRDTTCDFYDPNLRDFQ